MKINIVRALRGPNIWSRRLAVEAQVAIEDAETLDARTIGTLTAWLPRLDLQTPCAPHMFGTPAPIDSPVHALARVALTLQQAAGCRVVMNRTSSFGAGTYKVVVEYTEESVGREALKSAAALIEAATQGTAFDVAAAIDALRKEDQNIRLGPSTGSIVRAAENRGIPTRRLNDGSLVQLGWGAAQRRILAAETDRTSAIGESIAQDKELTKTLLRSVGVPVPEGRPVTDADDAWEAAQEIDAPVVVKPQYGSQGRGVAVNLTTKEQVVAAYAASREEGRSIIVEQFITGDDYRVLVVGERVVAAALRVPPRVTGDGQRTIEALVAEVNEDPRRGEDHATSLSKMRLDAIGQAVLAEQGFTTTSIPAAGQLVLLRRNANLSTGGSAIDVTDRIHPEVAARAVDAARIVGLDIAGIDVVCEDIARPLEEQRGVVVEVNAAPGLRMHLEPSEGTPRAVGEAIAAELFEPGDDGRIPLVAVTGNNGKTTTTRLMAHVFETWGLKTGFTCTDGIYVAGRRIDTGDCSGPKSARAVLMNPIVEAAVLEAARGGILREGLGFDRADVAIITNVGEGDHLGMNGIDTIEQLAAVKGTLAENVSETGAAVLNANDPRTLAMASRCPGSIVLFARDLSHPALSAHLMRGGRGVFVRDGFVVSAVGMNFESIAPLAEVPLTLGGRIGFQVENVLAAVAAACFLDVPTDVIRRALATFESTAKRVPGRFNLRQWGDVTVAIDYGHNPDAIVAVIDAIAAMPHERRIAVFTAAGDRRDEDIVRQARLLAGGFDRVHIYEDACMRGRADGAVLELLRRGFEAPTRLSEVIESDGEHAAIEECLRLARPGDVLFVQIDQVDKSLAFLDAFLANNAGPVANAFFARAS